MALPLAYVALKNTQFSLIVVKLPRAFLRSLIQKIHHPTLKHKLMTLKNNP
jgi:hypothetical protein